MRRLTLLLLATTVALPLSAQAWRNADTTKKTNQSTFRALEDWPAPNEARNASGAPGAKYWQQKVDYSIRASLDTVRHGITGSERVTYHNNSPDKLNFVWFQMDQDIERKDSRAAAMERALPATLSDAAKRFALADEDAEGGYEIRGVRIVGADGRRTPARTVRNGTVMRVDVPGGIAPKGRAVIEIDWSFVVPEAGRNARGVRELVKAGWMYEVAQWFPRASVYDDVNGWQTDQFIGQGEFYLNFGDYDVAITVPRDHIVRATGTLANPLEVLTATQRSRLAKAMTGETPVFIIDSSEVGTSSSRPAGSGPLTWRWSAKNVRDFAFATSRAYVWDAAGFRYSPTGRVIEMHSIYPREAMPLWNKVSTKAIAQTMRTYGRMAFEYPYPQASNVHGPVFGMEYPMLAFCGARPQPDGSYTSAVERSLVGVTIHEVGHNWFPMIVASDERKWTWMDEGLNSFLQYYAEQEWQKDFPSRRGPARNIVDYMRQSAQVPIMTESDAIQTQFGNNGYSKPAAGLVMLREQILGDSLFDAAFREYSQRWMFKHPQPADFFRSLEDGSGELLSWFWRGWFYTTYANDQALAKVESMRAEEYVGSAKKGKFYHRITIKNEGGLILPVQLELTASDGTTRLVRLPADVWRNNEHQFEYGFWSEHGLQKVVLDPAEVLADVRRQNNVWTSGPATSVVP